MHTGVSGAGKLILRGKINIISRVAQRGPTELLLKDYIVLNVLDGKSAG